MNKKMLFIFNPFSGKAQIKYHLMAISDIFTKGGYDVTVHPTQEQGDAYRTVKQCAESFDIVSVCGGDGTLNECVNGLLALPPEKRPPLGYIPAGSTNDYAATLCIPKNMEKAAQQIITGTPHLCDAGRFNDNNFVYVAAFGAFTDVSFATPQKVKNIMGHTAYVLEGIKKLGTIKPIKLKIEYDSGIAIEGEYILGFVLNSRSVAGIKGKGRLKTKLDDGLFEVILIKNPNNPLELQNLLADFIKKNFASPYFTLLKTSHIRLSSENDIQWTLDGEDGGTHKTVEIGNINKAYRIICNSSADNLFD